MDEGQLSHQQQVILGISNQTFATGKGKRKKKKHSHQQVPSQATPIFTNHKDTLSLLKSVSTKSGSVVQTTQNETQSNYYSAIN